MNDQEISKNYNEHLVNIIQEQALPVLNNLMASDDLNPNKFYYVNIKKVKIINAKYIHMVLETQEIVTAIDSNNKRHSMIIILFDPKAKVENYQLKKLQDNFDYVIAQYNIHQKNIGMYQLISHVFPALNKYTEFTLQFKDALEQFVHNVVGNKIIQQFQASSYYNNNKSEVETQILKLRLFDPQLDLGEYPKSWRSNFSIKANLINKNNQVVFKQQINSGDVAFVNYNCMQWFYSGYAYDYTPQHWNQVMQQYYDSLVNTNLAFHSEDDIIKIKLLSYNSLSEGSQFLLSNDPQKIENVQRLMQLLQAKFLSNIVLNYKFDQDNNLITLTLNNINDKSQINNQFICGPNGIIQKDWKHYIYKPGENNLLDAKRTLQKTLNLPYYVNYHKQINNYQDILQNETNLLIDSYNKRYTLSGLETMAKLSAMKINNIKAMQSKN